MLWYCFPRFLASNFSVSWFITSKTVSEIMKKKVRNNNRDQKKKCIVGGKIYLSPLISDKTFYFSRKKKIAASMFKISIFTFKIDSSLPYPFPWNITFFFFSTYGIYTNNDLFTSTTNEAANIFIKSTCSIIN